MNKKLFAIIPLIAIVWVSLSILMPLKTEANSSFFLPTSQTATATSSPSYINAGNATTTVYAPDSYATGQTRAFDQMVLLTQFAGSSTASTLNISFEYAQNGISGANCVTVPTSCDWYSDNLNNLLATTSPIASIVSSSNTLSWTFASSTRQGAAVNATTGATSTKAFYVTPPLRYMRVVFTIPPGAQPGAIWAQFVPLRQSVN